MASNLLPSTLSFTSNGGSFAPHGIITVDDHGPYIVVANWIFMCIVVLTSITRLATRVKAFDSLGVDNIIIVIAAVSAYKLRSGHLSLCTVSQLY